MNNRYRELLRRKALSELYGRMSDDERHALLQFAMSDQNHQEVMSALNEQHTQIDLISKRVGRQNWWVDFGSDVAANFLTDGILFLGSKILKRL
jgi:hypothetical protein